MERWRPDPRVRAERELRSLGCPERCIEHHLHELKKVLDLRQRQREAKAKQDQPCTTHTTRRVKRSVSG